MVVSGTKIEGGTQTISAGVQKTIKSIKEIVGNHSDADIYVTLKETNMDPNESVQKLLHQDTFHEVKRRRDKKKENTVYKDPVQPRKNVENVGQGMKYQSTVYKDSVQPRKNLEGVGQEMKYDTFSDRNGRRGGYTRNSFTDAGRSREFRVVRDNRVNQNANRETKPASQQCSTSANEPVTSNLSEKGSTGTSNSQKPLGHRTLSQAPNGLNDSHLRPARDANSSGSDMKELSERRTTTSNTALRGHSGKPNDSQRHSARPASSNSVVGVYSSSSDPVHVPSLDSRSSAAVGAIRREVGVVGVRRQSAESVKHSPIAGSLSNSGLGRDNSPSAESVRHFSSISKGNQLSQATAPESVLPSTSVSRPFLSNQYGSRSHQQPVGHQKAFQPNKEWKPKSSKKSSVIVPGVIESPAKSDLPSADNPADNSSEFKTEAVQLQDTLSQVDIFENQNVVIAEHIRVAETDRCLLTFGSIGPGFQAVGSVEESRGEPSASLSIPAQESSRDDISGSKQVDKQDDHVASSGSHSPASGASAAHQFPDKKDSLSPQNLDSYADIGMVRENNQFYAPSESQQHQEATELPSFSAYDPQSGYDIPYFRPTMEESLRGQGLPSPQEALSSYSANSIPASTIAMVQQQQQPPVAQMYPQVHVSHYANLMPYRQFLSPVYVPPMAMPGYSNNPAYPHPSNGNSYLLMPGGNSHPNANNLKYGIQQFKPLPTGSPTGFGNFTSPTGYPMSTPGVVGSAIGLEDSSRLKYKDGNLYVSNPQAETSEIWIQNPRDLPGMQSAPYYNMAGQTPHGAYLPSHTGHASFNAAAQSSHMQFPGLYHPQQPGGLGNPHHLAPAMGGNVGVGVAGAAPGAQVGAYQQPQLNHLNWITNL